MKRTTLANIEKLIFVLEHAEDAPGDVVCRLIELYANRIWTDLDFEVVDAEQLGAFVQDIRWPRSRAILRQGADEALDVGAG